MGQSLSEDTHYVRCTVYDVRQSVIRTFVCQSGCRTSYTIHRTLFYFSSAVTVITGSFATFPALMGAPSIP